MILSRPLRSRSSFVLSMYFARERLLHMLASHFFRSSAIAGSSFESHLASMFVRWWISSIFAFFAFSMNCNFCLLSGWFLSCVALPFWMSSASFCNASRCWTSLAALMFLWTYVLTNLTGYSRELAFDCMSSTSDGAWLSSLKLLAYVRRLFGAAKVESASVRLDDLALSRRFLYRPDECSLWCLSLCFFMLFSFTICMSRIKSGGKVIQSSSRNTFVHDLHQ